MTGCKTSTAKYVSRVITELLNTHFEVVIDAVLEDGYKEGFKPIAVTQLGITSTGAHQILVLFEKILNSPMKLIEVLKS